MPPESDFARTLTLGAEAQKGSITGVLRNIPLPVASRCRMRRSAVRVATCSRVKLQ